MYKIRAFPTYVLFERGGAEVGRVEGVKLEEVARLVGEHCRGHDFGSGHSLGGAVAGGAAAVVGGGLSLEEARAQRLARLGGDTSAASTTAAERATEEDDVEEMKDAAAAAASDDIKMQVDEVTPTTTSKEVEMVDPTTALKQQDVDTLTSSMGFSIIRAQKGLLNGNGTVEGAVEWLLTHQEDDDIDDPIEMVPAGGGAVAQSYKCNECGKILSNMANLELHANKTGHSDFEESTQLMKALTEEEKKAKIEEIKGLLKAKRAQREEAEKEENVDREKQRRFMGKEMAKVRFELC